MQKVYRELHKRYMHDVSNGVPIIQLPHINSAASQSV